MIFTGKNLQRVRDALTRAISDVNNEIGQCADVERYAQELVELEDERDKYEALLARVDRSLESERA